MFERISLMLGRVFTVSIEDLKREEGQGATEYALVIAFVVLTLGLALGALSGGITGFLQEVATELGNLV